MISLREGVSIPLLKLNPARHDMEGGRSSEPRRLFSDASPPDSPADAHSHLLVGVRNHIIRIDPPGVKKLRKKAVLVRAPVPAGNVIGDRAAMAAPRRAKKQGRRHDCLWALMKNLETRRLERFDQSSLFVSPRAKMLAT